MSSPLTPASSRTRPVRRRWVKPAAAFAALFGALTIFSGGMVLFGPGSARAAAGDYVPFVVWFNFIAGFFYILTAFAMWRGASWALPAAVALAAATGVTFAAFILYMLTGGAYEARTIAAMTLRTAIWLAIATGLARTAKAEA